MPATSILSHPWEEYDNRKWLADKDRNIFCPDEPWELNYLMEKIREYYPMYSEIPIALAIRHAAKTIDAPRNRTRFVNTVIKRLLEKKPASFI